MSVKEIREEEDRRQKESIANARASRKQKHQAISFLLEDEDVIEDPACYEIKARTAPPNNGKPGTSDDNSEEESGVIVAPPLLLIASQDAEDTVDNQTEVIQKLRDRVLLLETEIVRLQKSEYRWRTKYKNFTQKEQGAENGSTLIESVHKAVNVFMHSEDQYMEMSGRRSDKARHQYRYAVASSIWTNKSTFYEYLRPLLIDHVKKHLRETVFHPARILMRMDMAGGMLSMEGLEVLWMCETDGEKYVCNTVISCSVEIKHCCMKVDNLTKLVVLYEHSYLEAKGGGKWDLQHLLAGMIKAYQLTEVAKE